MIYFYVGLITGLIVVFLKAMTCRATRLEMSLPVLANRDFKRDRSAIFPGPQAATAHFPTVFVMSEYILARIAKSEPQNLKAKPSVGRTHTLEDLFHA